MNIKQLQKNVFELGNKIDKLEDEIFDLEEDNSSYKKLKHGGTALKADIKKRIANKENRAKELTVEVATMFKNSGLTDEQWNDDIIDCHQFLNAREMHVYLSN